MRIGIALLAIGLTIACDPGMSIYQVESKEPEKFSIRIATQHPLIAEKWYSPTLTFVNFTAEPITITNVELITSNGTYQPTRIESNSFVLPASGARTAYVFYGNLRNPVYKEFKDVAELRVHYRTKSGEGISAARIAGGKLSEH